MKTSRLACAALAAFATGAFAQSTSDYALNDGAVHFHVPAAWSAVSVN